MTDYVGANFDAGEMIGDGVVITCKAGGAITKGTFVKLSDATDLGVVTATDKANVLGVAMKAASASGEYIPICVRGLVKMKLGSAVSGTLAAGKALKSDADGLPDALADQAVNEAGSATYTIYYNAKAGIPLQSGQAGDYVMVLVGK